MTVVTLELKRVEQTLKKLHLILKKEEGFVVGSEQSNEECFLLKRYPLCGYFGAGWYAIRLFSSNLLVLPGTQRLMVDRKFQDLNFCPLGSICPVAFFLSFLWEVENASYCLLINQYLIIIDQCHTFDHIYHRKHVTYAGDPVIPSHGQCCRLHGQPLPRQRVH